VHERGLGQGGDRSSDKEEKEEQERGKTGLRPGEARRAEERGGEAGG
jgi:hypothetical protein